MEPFEEVAVLFWELLRSDRGLSSLNFSPAVDALAGGNVEEPSSVSSLPDGSEPSIEGGVDGGVRRRASL